MLWFNNVKDHGYIATEAGQRLYVHGSGFRDGSRPQGRCAGRPVSLHVLGDGRRTSSSLKSPRLGGHVCVAAAVADRQNGFR
jgi:cold shock CspA family protein